MQKIKVLKIDNLFVRINLSILTREISNKLSKKTNLAVLISGSGTTLRNLINKIDAGILKGFIKIVISSNPEAVGLNYAKASGIDTSVINRKNFKNKIDFSRAITEVVDKYHVDLILLAGFSHFYNISEKYTGKVMNIHPSLIPDFCGKGFYGKHVHKAVLQSNVKISGCTVHFADNEYDHGPIILQRRVDVMEDDTPDTLAKRIAAEECIAYPDAINMFASGKLNKKIN